jgi:hypothetical protein
MMYHTNGRAKRKLDSLLFSSTKLTRDQPGDVVTVNQDAAFISIKTGNERIPSLGAADTRVSFALVSSAVT